MSDFAPSASVSRQELLRLVRARVADTVPDGRLIAEDILGAESRIDFVAVEPSGHLTVIVVGEPGEELAAIARALAHRAWVEARVPDWLQFAPELGTHAGAGVGASVLCPSFGDDARTAAASLGESTLRLVRYHFVRDGDGLELLVEKPPPPAVDPPAHSSTSPRTPPQSPPPGEGPLAPVFRTSLSEADLGASEQERHHFE